MKWGCVFILALVLGGCAGRVPVRCIAWMETCETPVTPGGLRGSVDLKSQIIERNLERVLSTETPTHLPEIFKA